MQRNSTSSGRAKVEKLLECKGTPTLVYYGDGTLAIQHPIVFNLMQPIMTKNVKVLSSSESDTMDALGL